MRDLVQDKPDEVKARFEQDAGGKEAFIEFRKKKIHDRYRERAAHMLGSCSLTEKPLAWKEAGRQLKLAKNPPRRGPKWIAGDQLLAKLNKTDPDGAGPRISVALAVKVQKQPVRDPDPIRKKGA